MYARPAWFADADMVGTGLSTHYNSLLSAVGRLYTTRPRSCTQRLTMDTLQNRLDRILITEQQIADRVRTLAEEISSVYRRQPAQPVYAAGRNSTPTKAPNHERYRSTATRLHRVASDDPLILVAILSGSLVFLADLIRQLPVAMRIGLLTASSYPGTSTTSQGVVIRNSLDESVAGRDVLVIDDILDTGATLREVCRQLSEHKPRSLRTCVLLRKGEVAGPDMTADFVGFEIENAFVVGYGLDYDNLYRNLPNIAVLDETRLHDSTNADH